MIFLTVGTQLPFDRLVRAVDQWVGEKGVERALGQIADPGPQGYRPKHFPWKMFIDPQEFDRCFSEAQLIIAHAGMGSIISALTSGKPIVVMPRLAQRAEHRNDHQVATAQKFRGRPNIWVANDEESFPAVLDNAFTASYRESIPTGEARDVGVDESLIAAIRQVVLSSNK